MSFVLFLRGYLLTLVLFAAAAWLISGSLTTTLVATAIAALLIQVGYVLAILLLVARSPGPATATPKTRDDKDNQEPADPLRETGRGGS